MVESRQVGTSRRGPAERPHNVRAGSTGPRTRMQPGRPSRSERTDRVSRRRGVWEITSVDQSADQTGSAGPGSWTNSRSLTYWSSRIGGGALSSGASKPARSGRFKSSHVNDTRITRPCKSYSRRPCSEDGSWGR